MTLESNLTSAFQTVGADVKRLNTAVAGSALRTRTAANEAAPTATNWSARPVGYSRVIAPALTGRVTTNEASIAALQDTTAPTVVTDLSAAYTAAKA